MHLEYEKELSTDKEKMYSIYYTPLLLGALLLAMSTATCIACSMAKRSLQRSEMDYREFRKEDDVEFANASTF
ncbi:hypothetical protein EB796_006571 [Bugula neritina]|uniref:Uncharacterized protein n=1 Tax=Bugula neritina TaxID=10212 RepID=A0A7J7KAB2_BUGNE|nr:hypothetical protein EB796_006571 [Bugula neritina]